MHTEVETVQQIELETWLRYLVVQTDQRIWLDRPAGPGERAAEALSRFSAGTYGTCLSCGGVIPEARLHALPLAALCDGCQAGVAHLAAT